MLPLRRERNIRLAFIRASRQSNAGNTLTEYGLILGLVFILGVATVMQVGQAGQEKILAVASALKNLTPTLKTDPAPDKNGTASILATPQAVPIQGTFMLTLGSGKKVIIENYPIQDYNVSETGQVTATKSSVSTETRKIATQLHILAGSLGTETALSAEQADILENLSQQANRIADFEHPLEELQKADTEHAQWLLNGKTIIHGQAYLLTAIAEKLRTEDVYGKDGEEMEALNALMEEARAKGLLDDPVIQRMITHMAQRIKSLAGNLDNKSGAAADKSINPESTEKSVIGGNG